VSWLSFHTFPDFFTALALCGASTVFAQVAQVIPLSEPGRERERFEQSPPLLARHAGPMISLPSSIAPAGARTTNREV
jgi:hypothetical protein